MADKRKTQLGEHVDQAEVSYEPVAPVYQDGVVVRVKGGHYYRVSDGALVVWVLPPNYDPTGGSNPGRFVLFDGHEEDYLPTIVEDA